MILLGIAYFGIVFALYGLGFWLPQIVDAFGFYAIGTGLITAIPYLCGALAMMRWSKTADRTGDYSRHAALACCVAAFGLTASAWFQAPIPFMLAISVAATGTLAVFPAFWALPTAFVYLSRTAASAGIALINSIGRIGLVSGPTSSAGSGASAGEISWAMLGVCPGLVLSAILILSVRACGAFSFVTTLSTAKRTFWPSCLTPSGTSREMDDKGVTNSAT